MTTVEPPHDDIAGISTDERTWAILVHASAFVGMVFPFGHIIAPLVIWLIKRHDSPFVDANGKQAVNFQLSMTVYGLIAALLILVVIGFVLVPLVIIAWFVLVILATLRAGNDEVFEYPLTIRFVS